MKFKKMLFVTDFDELWFDALESLMELRKAGLNHVVFLHVIRKESVTMRRGKGYLKDEDIRLRQMADVRFIEWAESIFEKGMECGAYVVVGDPLPKILSTAETEGIDLIVTKAHKTTKLERLYAGSTTIELLRRSKTPVLVHKYMLPSGKINDKPFEVPLFTTDWSSPCERALEQIITLKNIVKKVVVVHVVNDETVKGKSKNDLMKIQKENKKTFFTSNDKSGNLGKHPSRHSLYMHKVKTGNRGITTFRD